ncbi:PadR family transcriptional regulator [Brachybacterium aquaticum]|uniref:DNA-binding PadR family transcriptional regulator n=1 Tax=Brachybacterium aquaticum TaxID=1432564 RepID=A0A841AHF1_9MICO|nr:helix-turn-helix transcriptional regulator [Brachybacterium aquaticum]MBB5832692.1 DNA-binding PadR family transcriptional regulator [Brachybacterium aquaticum]
MSADPTPPVLSSEDAEWAQELASSWVEVYKKSATTLALLRIIREHGPIAAAGIAPLVLEATGWTLTESGLYRTLRRLADSGVLSARKVDVARTGAKRQDFALTPVGAEYLRRIEAELI